MERSLWPGKIYANICHTTILTSAFTHGILTLCTHTHAQTHTHFLGTIDTRIPRRTFSFFSLIKRQAKSTKTVSQTQQDSRTVQNAHKVCCLRCQDCRPCVCVWVCCEASKAVSIKLYYMTSKYIYLYSAM